MEESCLPENCGESCELSNTHRRKFPRCEKKESDKGTDLLNKRQIRSNKCRYSTHCDSKKKLCASCACCRFCKPVKDCQQKETHTLRPRNTVCQLKAHMYDDIIVHCKSCGMCKFCPSGVLCLTPMFHEELVPARKICTLLEHKGRARRKYCLNCNGCMYCYPSGKCTTPYNHRPQGRCNVPEHNLVMGSEYQHIDFRVYCGYCYACKYCPHGVTCTSPGFHRVGEIPNDAIKKKRKRCSSCKRFSFLSVDELCGHHWYRKTARQIKRKNEKRRFDHGGTRLENLLSLVGDHKTKKYLDSSNAIDSKSFSYQKYKFIFDYVIQSLCPSNPKYLKRIFKSKLRDDHMDIDRTGCCNNVAIVCLSTSSKISHLCQSILASSVEKEKYENILSLEAKSMFERTVRSIASSQGTLDADKKEFEEKMESKVYMDKQKQQRLITLYQLAVENKQTDRIVELDRLLN